MATLQKTFAYTGRNKEYLAKYFPKLERLSAEFSFPVYTFSQSAAEENIKRNYVNNIALHFKVSIQDVAYRKEIDSLLITGSDAILFYKHYIINFAGQRRLNFSSYMKHGICQIDLMIASYKNCHTMDFLFFTKR